MTNVMRRLVVAGVSAWACVSLVLAQEEALPLAASPFGTVVAAYPTHSGERDDLTRSNRVAIVDNGYEALLLRVHLIRSATRSISIQTFIWTNDEVGRLIMCELIEAARRGVRVRIIADALVSEKDPEIVAFLATVHPNLEIKHYRPPANRINPSKLRTMMSGIFHFKSTNQRMHNKLMVFDESVMITGGRNIENTYYNQSTGLNFRDRDVVAVGPVVREAVKSFEEFWRFRESLRSVDLVDVSAAIDAGTFKKYERRSDYDFGGLFGDLDAQIGSRDEVTRRFVSKLKVADKVTFVADEPGKTRHILLWGRGRITKRLSNAILKAEKSVVIQTPYLVFSDAGRNCILELRKKSPGVRVIISSNSFASTDNLMAYAANYRLRATYIGEMGLRIYEYKPHPASMAALFPQYAEMEKRSLVAKRKEGEVRRAPFLCVHAKSLVVDDSLAFIGSYNLDPRSETINTEVGLMIEDGAVAAELKSLILEDTRAANSWVIARRPMPLQLDKVNALVDGLTGLLPLDLWPIQNTTSYELVPGKAEVPPDDPDFYRNYRDEGAFPGAEGIVSNKEITTRLYKVVGKMLTPIL